MSLIEFVLFRFGGFAFGRCLFLESNMLICSWIVGIVKERAVAKFESLPFELNVIILVSLFCSFNFDACLNLVLKLWFAGPVLEC